MVSKIEKTGAPTRERKLPDWFKVKAPGGENYLEIRKKIKGEKDINQRYVLNPDAPHAQELADVAAARGRFAEPSKLRD